MDERRQKMGKGGREDGNVFPGLKRKFRVGGGDGDGNANGFEVDDC